MKEKKEKVLQVCIEPSLQKAVHAHCAKTGRTPSGLVRYLLNEYLKEQNL